MTSKERLYVEEIERLNEILRIIRKWFLETLCDYTEDDGSIYVDAFIREDEEIYKILLEWLS